MPFSSKQLLPFIFGAIAPCAAFAETTFDFYGQINFGLFNVDDGTETESFFVDNDNSNTRIGFIYSEGLSNGATAKFHFESALGFNGSAAATITNNDGGIDLDRTELRKLEVIYESNSWGTVSVGQGSMAADGTAEADLSGTSVITYSGIPDLAGSFAFRPAGGVPSGTTVGDAFSNLDGGRRFRGRYDTSSLNGFKGSVSYGEEFLNEPDDRNFTDVAVRYANDYGDMTVNAQLGYQWIDDDSGDEEILAGSFALLHEPSGFNVALSSGAQQQGDASYVYAKLGYQADWFTIGRTFLSIDFYDGSDFSADGSDSSSYALAAVQKVERYGVEIYAAFRSHEYDEAGTNFEDIDVFALGARWKF